MLQVRLREETFREPHRSDGYNSPYVSTFFWKHKTYDRRGSPIFKNKIRGLG